MALAGPWRYVSALDVRAAPPAFVSRSNAFAAACASPAHLSCGIPFTTECKSQPRAVVAGRGQRTRNVTRETAPGSSKEFPAFHEVSARFHRRQKIAQIIVFWGKCWPCAARAVII